MRLIDGDELMESIRKALGIKSMTKSLLFPAERTIIDQIESAPTVDIFQKLWNALYAEEDKFEKRYISTPEHDNWFLFYRPWLQNGFEIAIKVLSEIFVSEPPKEEN